MRNKFRIHANLDLHLCKSRFATLLFDDEVYGVEVGLALATAFDLDEPAVLQFLYRTAHRGHVRSHVLGKATGPDELKQIVKGNAPLTEAYGRMAEHLAANGVDLGKTRAAFGAALTLEEGKERFTGEFAPAANRLLSRAYRAPFVVPQLA